MRSFPGILSLHSMCVGCLLGAVLGEACLQEVLAMQMIGVDEAGRKKVSDALAAAALRETAELRESEYGGYEGTLARQRTALQGMKVALPFAVLLWGLIAGMLWVAAR